MVKDDIFSYILFPIVLLGAAYIYLDINDDFDLKCIVSSVDGNKYCVRERSKINDAADLLANVTQKCQDLVKYMEEKYPTKENVKRLCSGFEKTVIKETLPTSTFTAYSENKGEKIAFCLNKKKEDNNTLLNALPTVNPKPGSKGLNSNLPEKSVDSIIITLSGF